MNIERSMLKITDRCRGSIIIRPTAILTILWFCGKRISNQVKSNMYKCYGNKVASSRMYKRDRENRNDTVTVNGELFLNTTGKPGRESSVEQVRQNALLWDPGFAVYESVFSITIQNFIFMCIARESCVSRRPQKAAVFLYISVFWKYMKRGR